MRGRTGWSAAKGAFALRRLREWSPGTLARNTVLGSGWQVFRLGVQLLYLVSVARILGAEGYGWFAGTVALATSLAPLAGWGFGFILVKQVSRQPNSFPVYWARVIAAVILPAPLLVAVTLVLAMVLLPESNDWAIVLLIVCSELVLVPLIWACANVYQAHEKLGRSAFVHVLLNLCRLAAVTVLVVGSAQVSVGMFVWTYFAATLLSAVLVVTSTVKEYGRPNWNLNGMQEELREGLAFSASLVAGSAHAEIDKTLLLRLAGAANAGVYSAGIRVAAAAALPLVSYVLAAVPRLFREGARGVGPSAMLAWKLLPPILAYGVLVGGGLFACAPFLPVLLGDDFTRSVAIIRYLAALPLLIGVSLLFLSVLSCSGRQPIRLAIECLSLGLNVALNLTLIPTLGSVGAVLSVLASQAALTLVVLFVIIWAPR